MRQQTSAAAAAAAAKGGAAYQSPHLAKSERRNIAAI
jgi:hypothetical protein